jgi:hypothetical protein
VQADIPVSEQSAAHHVLGGQHHVSAFHRIPGERCGRQLVVPMERFRDHLFGGP